MRINDIVNEAISTTQYEATVDSAVRLSIAQAMSEIAGLKGQFPKEEKALLKQNPKPLFLKLHESLQNALASRISQIVKVKLSRALGNEIPLNISFGDVGKSNAIATDTDITVSPKYVKQISKKIIENVYSNVIESYDLEHQVDGAFYTFKLVGSQDKTVTPTVLEDTDTVINSLVDVVLHELTHVVQHHKQLSKGRTDTEYRSYLDSKKGELGGINASGADLNATDDRYYDLYYASPQEIAAHANEMAMAAIRKYNLRKAKSEQDITPITAEEISSFVRKYIKDRYSDPKTPKEHQVFKRYAKLVYQEIQRYVDRIRKTFK